jgi:geranylgeranyl diphosphate synthase type I
VDDLIDAETVEDVTEAEIDEAVAELEAAGSIDYAKETAAELAARSKESLQVLPDNESRRLLEDIAEFFITRGY